MELDPGLVCYRHCEQGLLVAPSLPPFCKHCDASLNQSEALLDTPYRLPFPFRRASQSPCSIVIKPTKGDFLHEYSSGDDLHVGITDSDCRVHEFSAEGLLSDATASFNECLVVTILEDPEDPVWKEYWNTALHDTIGAQQWTEEQYDEDDFNCYTFVIEFLKILKPPILNQFQISKISFCSSFVVPRALSAARYISIYRTVQKEGLMAIKLPKPKKRTNPPPPKPPAMPNESDHNCFLTDSSQSDSDVVQKLENLVFGKKEPRNNFRSNSDFRQRKPVEKLKTNNVSTGFESIAEEPEEGNARLSPEIETRVNEVINDLLKNSHQQKSAKYCAPYADDIKEDLRSLVPKPPSPPKNFISDINRAIVSQNDLFKNNSFYVNPGNNYIESNKENIPNGEEHQTIAINSDENETFQYDFDSKNNDNENVSHRIVLDIKPPLPKSDNSPVSNKTIVDLQVDDCQTEVKQDKNRETNRHDSFGKSSIVSGSSSYELKNFINRSFLPLNPSKKYERQISPTSKLRTSRSENFCPEYDWFGGNTLKKKRKKKSIWVQNMNFADTKSSSGEVSYDEWCSNSLDSDESEIYASIPLFNSQEIKTGTKNVTDNIADMYAKINKPSSSAGSTNSKSLITTPVPSGIGNGYLIPQGYNSNTEVSGPSSNCSVTVGSGDNINVIYIDDKVNENTTDIQSIDKSSVPNENQNYSSVKKVGKKKNPGTLRRAPTWRYGQEPCPENYEGKLMGKIDLSKKREWEAKGLPSTLSMPGYIYDEGVLTETYI